MARWLITVLLLGVAIIHLLPAVGVLSVERLRTLYGIGVDDPNLEILLRHRAVLFGLLGVAIAGAAFVRPWQGYAIAAALISVVSFLIVAFAVGDYNDAIGRVVTADVVALGALLVAGLVRAFTP
ncbi:MAG: phosphopantetheine adenylyltransferase [Pseudomonadota bacterium]